MSETEELIESLKAVSTKRDTFQSAILAKSAVNSAMAFLCRARGEFAAAIFRTALGENAEKEKFMALPLDPKRRPLSEPQTIAVGTLNGVNVHPRDVFSIAVRWNAHSIVVAHNHPSGGLEPSKRDLDLTWCLHDAGRMMGIPLVDHIILTDRSHYSFADNCRLSPPDAPARPEAKQQGE